MNLRNARGFYICQGWPLCPWPHGQRLPKHKDQSDTVQTIMYLIFEAIIYYYYFYNCHLCFIKSRHQGCLGLQHQTCICWELLHLAQKLCILWGEPPLLTVKVTQVESSSVTFLGKIGQAVRQGAMGLVSRCLEKFTRSAVDSFNSGSPLNG